MAESHDEIMRRLADAALRRRQAQRMAHRPVEKRIALCLRRPDAFVEAAEQHHIGGHEPGFEQTENLEARMRPPRPPQHPLAHHLGEEDRIAFGIEEKVRLAGLQKLVEKIIERHGILAERRVFAARDLGERGAMRRDPGRQVAGVFDRLERRERGVEAVKQIGDLGPIRRR